MLRMNLIQNTDTDTEFVSLHDFFHVSVGTLEKGTAHLNFSATFNGFYILINRFLPYLANCNHT